MIRRSAPWHFALRAILALAGVFAAWSADAFAPKTEDEWRDEWRLVGSMTMPRAHHTATRLPDGRVLVAGGYTQPSDDVPRAPTATAEIYDPVSGTWSVTGQMSNPRARHEALRLANGDVMVQGGHTTLAGPVAEIFDAATGTWRAVTAGVGDGSSATLLRSGQILIAGGYYSDIVADAHLYDPVADTSTPTGSLRTARFGHVAVLLADGRVLVAGGDDFVDGISGHLAEHVEVYDPLTGAWSPTGDLVPPFFPSETLTTLADGRALFIAADSLNDLDPRAAIYDPLGGTWSTLANAPRGSDYHSATLLADGRVIVAGGFYAPTRAQVYEPFTNTWRVVGSLSNERASHTATLLHDGSVLVAGGEKLCCSSAIATAEIFRPASSPGLAPVIEYRHAALDHYFITTIPDEIAKLDSGLIAGWTRTGFQFDAYTASTPGTSPVCRFYSTAFGDKSSHFYSPFESECASLRSDPRWTLESDAAFRATPASADGACVAGLAPVYRLFNDGQGGAPNHRYTIDRNVRADMIARGWVPEGFGPDAVQLCSPR